MHIGTILYRVDLDLPATIVPRPWWNLPAQRRNTRRLERCLALTNWIHNLAEFSRRDFEGFREEEFWKEYDRLETPFPGYINYRRSFDETLANYDGSNR
jgi:hypothetical protein